MTSFADSLKKHWAAWIVLIIMFTYVPFLDYRVVRTAGDEKVYVSQALEMAAHGNWFSSVSKISPIIIKDRFITS